MMDHAVETPRRSSITELPWPVRSIYHAANGGLHTYTLTNTDSPAALGADFTTTQDN